MYIDAAGTTGITNEWPIYSTDANPSYLAGSLQASAYLSDANCASASGACGAAPAGAFTVAAGATTATVSTTAITANSEIIITPDSSLGTRLSVTCNTTLLTTVPQVGSRTPGTSFTVTLGTAPVTNPDCFSYIIMN